MANEIQPDPVRGAKFPSSAIMHVWDVISWIAFGELRPQPDFSHAVAFTLRWQHSNPLPLLDAIEARVAPEPYCIWQPVGFDGEPWDGRSFAHPAFSPAGPRMLRAVRAETRRRTGRLVSYAEVANLLGEEIAKLEADNEKIRLAKQDLLEALRSSKLHVWAKREAKPNTLNPSAQFEQLPGSVFMDDCLTLNDWGTVGADPERPMARYHYQGPTYREARFQTNDVLAVWPAAGDAEPAVGVVGLTVRPQRRAPGGAPPRHDWDAFWIEVCIWSEANGFEERDRHVLQKLMETWTAKHWSDPPDSSTIRRKMAQLYKRSREAR